MWLTRRERKEPRMTPRFLALSAKWKVIWPVETENLGWGCWFKKAAWAQNDQLFSLIFYLKWQGTYFERNEIITKLEKRKEWYQWTRSSEEFLEDKQQVKFLGEEIGAKKPVTPNSRGKNNSHSRDGPARGTNISSFRRNLYQLPCQSIPS